MRVPFPESGRKIPRPMKIALVEDERLFRDVLRKACTAELGHEVVAEAGTGREALLVVPAAFPIS